MHKVLITGGSGFIGSNFIKLIHNLEEFSQIIIVDKLTIISNYSNIKQYVDDKKIIFINADISDFISIEKIFNKYEIDSVINFAAETHVDQSIKDPKIFIQSNIIGTYNLLYNCLKKWKNELSDKIFFQISTDEVYGSLNENDMPVDENYRYNPLNPYSASKASADFLVKSFQNTYGLRTIISHSCNNYGYFQFPEKLIPLTIKNIFNGLMIPIYGDGKNFREWIFVEDCCRAILSIYLKGKVNSNYNISNNETMRNIDLVNLICKLTDNFLNNNKHYKSLYPNSPIYKQLTSSDLVSFVDDRMGHDYKYAINSSKLSNEIGFVFKTNLKEGLIKTISWYAKNHNWQNIV